MQLREFETAPHRHPLWDSGFSGSGVIEHESSIDAPFSYVLPIARRDALTNVTF